MSRRSGDSGLQNKIAIAISVAVTSDERDGSGGGRRCRTGKCEVAVFSPDVDVAGDVGDSGDFQSVIPRPGQFGNHHVCTGRVGGIHLGQVGVKIVGRANSRRGCQNREVASQVGRFAGQHIGDRSDAVAGVRAGSCLVRASKVGSDNNVAECAVGVAVSIDDRNLHVVGSLQRDISIFRLHGRTTRHQDVAVAVSVSQCGVVEVRAGTQYDHSKTGRTDGDGGQRNRVSGEQADVAVAATSGNSGIDRQVVGSTRTFSSQSDVPASVVDNRVASRNGQWTGCPNGDVSATVRVAAVSNGNSGQRVDRIDRQSARVLKMNVARVGDGGDVRHHQIEVGIVSGFSRTDPVARSQRR